MTKELLKKTVDEGIKEAYHLWSDYMTLEEYKNFEALLGMTVLTVLMKINKINKKEEDA
jgi:hypothetical protein